MRQQKAIRTTLGDLIVALTDEVARLIREPLDTHIVVFLILSDLLARNGMRPHEPAQQEYANYLAEN